MVEETFTLSGLSGRVVFIESISNPGGSQSTTPNFPGGNVSLRYSVNWDGGDSFHGGGTFFFKIPQNIKRLRLDYEESHQLGSQATSTAIGQIEGGEVLFTANDFNSRKHPPGTGTEQFIDIQKSFGFWNAFVNGEKITLGRVGEIEGKELSLHGSISTALGGASGAFVVKKVILELEPQIDIQDVIVNPQNPKAGDEITVNALVVNSGGEAFVGLWNFEFAGITGENTEVTVPANRSAQPFQTIKIPTNIVPNSYDIKITLEDISKTFPGAINVTEEEAPPPGEDGFLSNLLDLFKSIFPIINLQPTIGATRVIAELWREVTGQDIIPENVPAIVENSGTLNFLSVINLGEDLEGNKRDIPTLSETIDFVTTALLIGAAANFLSSVGAKLGTTTKATAAKPTIETLIKQYGTKATTTAGKLSVTTMVRSFFRSLVTAAKKNPFIALFAVTEIPQYFAMRVFARNQAAENVGLSPDQVTFGLNEQDGKFENLLFEFNRAIKSKDKEAAEGVLNNLKDVRDDFQTIKTEKAEVIEEIGFTEIEQGNLDYYNDVIGRAQDSVDKLVAEEEEELILPGEEEKPSGEIAPTGKAFVTVNSSPQGAHIWIDGKNTFTVTPFAHLLDAGGHNIQVQLLRYKPGFRNITVEGGINTVEKFDLELILTGEPEEPFVPVPIEIKLEKEEPEIVKPDSWEYTITAREAGTNRILNAKIIVDGIFTNKFTTNTIILRPESEYLIRLEAFGFKPGETILVTEALPG